MTLVGWVLVSLKEEGREADVGRCVGPRRGVWPAQGVRGSGEVNFAWHTTEWVTDRTEIWSMKLADSKQKEVDYLISCTANCFGKKFCGPFKSFCVLLRPRAHPLGALTIVHAGVYTVLYSIRSYSEMKWPPLEMLITSIRDRSDYWLVYWCE